MPLSEQEQRLLDEMERHLMSNDADVVSAPREGQGLSYRNIVYGAILVLAGVAALVVGVAVGQVIIGVLAFVAMVVGVVVAVTPAKGGTAAAAAPGRPKSDGKPSGASFKDRMKDRWYRRQERG